MNTSRIIKGVVGGGCYTVTAPIVKEDYGLYLKIEGVELPSTYEVDFSNSENNGTSVTMIGNADGVLIPRQFIDSGKDVFAFLYHVGADFGRTVYKFRIPNKLRPDRTDETPTPEEQSVIDQAISALNGAVAQTAQDKADADVSAQNASADADRAEEARTDAQNYATQAEQARNDAQTYANNASASATASAQSASQSAQIKADVEDLVDDAQGYAQASAQSASQASASEQGCARAVLDAASAAAIARARAEEANGYAQTASAKAQDASQSASTASQKATESTQSASQASGYASQAENAKTASQTAQGLAESARDSAVQAKTDAESAKADAETARDEAQSAVASISGALAEKAPVITDTASGAIASFTDGADDLPLKSLVVNIDPVQDLHGYDSPWVGGGGKNLLDISTLLNGAYSDAQFNIPSSSSTVYRSIKISLKAGTYTLSASVSIDVVRTLVDGGFDSTTYGNKTSHTFTTTTDGYVGLTIRRYDRNDWDDATKLQLESGSTATDWTPYENICPISGWTGAKVARTGKNILGGLELYNAMKATFTNSTFDDANHTVTSTPSQASGKKIIDIRFKANTAYTIIVQFSNNAVTSSGNGCPNIAFRYTDGSITSLSVPSYTVNQVIVAAFVSNPAKTLDMITGSWNTGTATIYCDNTGIFEGDVAVGDYTAYVGTTLPISWQTEAGTVYGGRLDVLSGKLTVYPYYASYNGETLTGEWISDRDVYAVGTTPTIGAQVVNVGAEGTEYQLEPHEIASLLGANNIWADTGDTEVEYRANTKLYINKKIAEAISALS